jgi:hypothetical protein
VNYPSQHQFPTLLRNSLSTLSILLLLNPFGLSAQAPAQAPGGPVSIQAQPGAPVPSQIASAHTIFLSNGGAENGFPIDDTEVYNNIYAALQSWGRYQLASTPEQADLIFKLRDVAPITLYDVYHGRPYSFICPAYRITIVSAKTNVTLWTVTSPVRLKGSKKVFEHWEELSVTNLVSRLKVLDGEQLSEQESADLTIVPKYHFGRNAAILVGAFVAAGAAGAVILHHEYENSLANQKASQDAFCTANNIPLSQCAGG